MADERAGGAVTEQPHEVLQRAANALEERAGKATPGPWRSHDTHLDLGGHAATVLAGEGNDVRLIAWLPTMSHEPWDRERNVWNDSQWVASMSPPVAAPLVAWLRTEAQYARVLKGFRAPAAEDMHVEHALTFARTVLGEAHEPPVS